MYTLSTVSIIAGILIFLLVVSEFSSYMTVTIKDHVVVDHTIGTKVQINFNISFYALHCGGTPTHTPLAASKLW